MTLLVHLLQILAGAFILYVGIAVVVSLAVLAFGIWLFKRRRTVIGHHWGPVVLVAALLVPTLHGSTVHVSRKQYAKEATAILKQYDEELVVYVASDHPGVMPVALNLYEQRAALDLKIAQDGLFLFRKGYASQDYVDATINQLSRDLEDIPPSMASSTDLKN